MPFTAAGGAVWCATLPILGSTRRRIRLCLVPIQPANNLSDLLSFCLKRQQRNSTILSMHNNREHIDPFDLDTLRSEYASLLAPAITQEDWARKNMWMAGAEQLLEGFVRADLLNIVVEENGSFSYRVSQTWLNELRQDGYDTSLIPTNLLTY